MFGDYPHLTILEYIEKTQNSTQITYDEWHSLIGEGKDEIKVVGKTKL